MIEKMSNGRKNFELTEAECKHLIELADEALKNTYPKGSQGFAVALMTKSGNIYTGISYLSETETLTMHSEMTALAHAAIHGENEVIAITGPNCHICKQLIYENSMRSGIDITIVIEEGNQIKQIPISIMMPYPWPEELDEFRKD
jgi:cytidine deaminase